LGGGRSRTAALGGHVARCEECTHEHIAYNSCRNRHCPKCQGAAAREWLAAREAELLPAPYFHVVFTVPAPIADITYQNKEWHDRQRPAVLARRQQGRAGGSTGARQLSATTGQGGSFGVTGQVQKVECRRCGKVTTRTG